MKPFEIYTCQPPGWDKPHPCVIVSHSLRAAGKNPVEVLMCSSQQAARPAEPHEIILDAADGLDWQTLCKCDVVYALPRQDLKDKRGAVAKERRQHIIRKIISAHGWGEILAG